MTLVFKSDPDRGPEWAAVLAEKAPDLPFRIWPDVGDPEQVRYYAGWDLPAGMRDTYPNLEVIFALGAGIEKYDFSAIPPDLPLVRMVEPGISGGMAEYVTMAVLSLHRQLIDYIDQQRNQVWKALRVYPASKSRVGVMGLGELGQSALRALAPFGFPLRGWSRSQHRIEGVRCYAGRAALPEFVAECDILVCLLPLTDSTRGILDGELFAALPRGASIVNASRGGNLVEADLLSALDSGHLRSAVLDVCRQEPLPAGHPFWTHPRILLTPHIATQTQSDTASLVVLDNIRRHQRGEPMLNVVDRGRGY